MRRLTHSARYLAIPPEPWLLRPPARLQPLVAREGRPNVDLDRLTREAGGVAAVEPPVFIRDAVHWAQTVSTLPDTIDAIVPVSIPAYPTEWWNSHPEPLVQRGLPVVFWPIQSHNEPDFWRWSAVDMLGALGVEVYLAAHHRQAMLLCRALAMRRMLRTSRMVVFGKHKTSHGTPPPPATL